MKLDMSWVRDEYKAWKDSLHALAHRGDMQGYLELASKIYMVPKINDAMSILFCMRIVEDKPRLRLPIELRVVQITPVIDSLLALRANVDAQGHQDRTPLVCTIQANEVQLVRELLNRGANMRIHSAQGLTPIQWAGREDAYRDNIVISRELMLRGAKLHEFVVNDVNNGHHQPDPRIVAFHGRILRARSAATCFLGLRQRVHLLRMLGRDVVKYLATLIYQTRGWDDWGVSDLPQEKKAAL
jgi:hypothetical protein